MNDSSVARDRTNLMVREHHALDNAELQARVTDLEDERDTYRVLLQHAIHRLAAFQGKEDNWRRDQQELNDLRAMVVAEYYEDAIAVIGSDTFNRVRKSLFANSDDSRPVSNGEMTIQ